MIPSYTYSWLVERILFSFPDISDHSEAILTAKYMNDNILTEHK